MPSCGKQQQSVAPPGGQDEVNALDNPEYFDGPLVSTVPPPSGGLNPSNKPLPPDPRTNLNNNIEADHSAFKTSKGAAAGVGGAPVLQKLGQGHTEDASDAYINTDYDHLGHSTATPLNYLNPRSESAV